MHNGNLQWKDKIQFGQELCVRKIYFEILSVMRP
jgi:hypothetical protein